MTMRRMSLMNLAIARPFVMLAIFAGIIFAAYNCHAQVEGKVTEVAGTTVKVAIGSGEIPKVGDSVKFFFKRRLASTPSSR